MLLKTLFPFLFFLISALSFLNSTSLAVVADAGDIEADKSGNSGSGETGHGFIGFLTGFYHNDDNGDGNPFLDEELTVIEPVIVFDYNVTDDLGLWGKLSYDYVSSASIDRLNKFPQQSGATGDFYFGLDSGLRYKISDTMRLGGFLSGSAEYDYTSFGIGGDVAKDSADKNNTVKLSINSFYDQIDIIRFDGDESEGNDTRTTVSSTANWYRIVNPNMHGELGATFSHQSGFLETAFNAVVIEDINTPNPNLVDNLPGREVTEELPDNRTRGVVFGRIRRFFEPGISLELGGRVYADSWGITSATLEPQFYKWLIEGILNVRVRYRFYIQTEADDFRDHFLVEQKFRTQDSDLGDFSAHLAGLKFNWQLNDHWKTDVSGDLIFRSDGIDQFLGSIGLTKKF